MTEYYCSKGGILKRTIDDISYNYCCILKREQCCLDCENVRQRKHNDEKKLKMEDSGIN